MPDSTPPEDVTADSTSENSQSFADVLSEFNRSNTTKPPAPGQQRSGIVVAINAESAILDLGMKTEGALPLTAFERTGPPKVGDRLQVSIKGRDAEGYYQLSLGRVERPTDWAALKNAFDQKSTILGTVTGVTKGGLSVDIGVRAFMPASRSGARGEAELAKLVEQEIRCRIIKLDEADEDVVVDRRVVLEEEERNARERRTAELRVGDTLPATVRTLTDYGAFVDLGGVDALLHVGDISHRRIARPEDALSIGQPIEVKVLRIDKANNKFSVGMKQLEPDPWDHAKERYRSGERAHGVVTRLMDFGAFVELEPGVEGLVHVSDMSWGKKVRSASDVLKVGDTVDVVVLEVKPSDDPRQRRIALGLKQALGDPWSEVAAKYPVGSVVEGKVASFTKFGAFVQIAEGVEGMVHVSDIVPDKRVDHPQDELRAGQMVRAQVLQVDAEKRRIKIGIKQMAPTSLDEYLAEHKVNDKVSGRVVSVAGAKAQVELGEGVMADCSIAASGAKSESSAAASTQASDVGSLSAMLKARWKGSSPSPAGDNAAFKIGEIRTFRIAAIDPEKKSVVVEPA